VTDLPVSMADNPFAALSVISQEVVMSKQQQKEQLDYLIKLTGNEDLAKMALSEKTSLKQAELQEAGVEQKEAKEEEAPIAEVAFDIDKIAKELGMEELSSVIADLQKSAEMLPVLENVIKQQSETIKKMGATEDERLEEKLTPPLESRFSWMDKARESASEKNEASKKDVENLGKGPGPEQGGWLAEATGNEPVFEKEQ